MNVAYSMLNIFALIILTILMVIFFSKKRLHSIEDNTYGWLLIVSFFTIVTGVTLGFLLDANIVNQKLMIIIFNKLYLVGLITTLSMFVFYTYNISRFYKEEKRSRNMIIYSIFIAFNIIVISLLPLNTFMADTGVMTKGLAMDYTSLLFGIIYTMLIIFCLIDFKHFNVKSSFSYVGNIKFIFILKLSKYHLTYFLQHHLIINNIHYLCYLYKHYI